MIIEIKGTGFINKGAEMMLLTIIQELKHNTVKFTTTPLSETCEYSSYSVLGIYPKLSYIYKRFDFGKFGKLLPKQIRNIFGLVIDKDVDVVLDASGFAYSSKWNEYKTKRMANDCVRWKKMDKKIILLPQAFGPLESKYIQKHMRRIIDNADIIYARDLLSYQTLLGIKDDQRVIRMFPDFTILLKGEVPPYYDNSKHQVCIVPNQRMIDKVDNSDNYMEFLTKIIKLIQLNGLQPYFLIHGGTQDENLAISINQRLTERIEIVNEQNPYYIKGIISKSKALIGSRFHSIASALYSSVPVIGTSWNHKYHYLFADFNFVEGLIETDASDDIINNKLKVVFDVTERNKLIEHLSLQNEKIKKKSEQMFNEVKQEIGLV
ncbi:MAG: polysaccharide pyruvyl transferase family protein [Candidatus Thiodiazotropha sp.]